MTSSYSSAPCGSDDDSVRQALTCPICVGVVTNVCETVCGHVFCGQ